MVLMLGLAALVFQSLDVCANAHAMDRAADCPEPVAVHAAMHHDPSASAGHVRVGSGEQHHGVGHHQDDRDTERAGHSCGGICHPPVVATVAPVLPAPLFHATAGAAARQPDLAGMPAPPATPPPRTA